MKRLDQYEKQILSDYEGGDLKSVVTSDASLRRYRDYARATLTKNRRVNIRLARAAEEGVPYQTLMTSVLHKFATGRLLERKSNLTLRSRRTTRKRTVA